jgi:hypothetical protein
MLDKRTMRDVAAKAAELRAELLNGFGEVKGVIEAADFHHRLGAFEVLALYEMYCEAKEENEQLVDELLTVQAYLLE